MNRIDEYLWKFDRYLMRKYGVDSAKRDMDALKWYVYTGRASVGILKRLEACQPYMIGRLLHQGGSIDEAVRRILVYAGCVTD